jgi:hypothetical protein
MLSQANHSIEGKGRRIEADVNDCFSILTQWREHRSIFSLSRLTWHRQRWHEAGISGATKHGAAAPHSLRSGFPLRALKQIDDGGKVMFPHRQAAENIAAFKRPVLRLMILPSSSS